MEESLKVVPCADADRVKPRMISKPKQRNNNGVLREVDRFSIDNFGPEKLRLKGLHREKDGLRACRKIGS
ncbi:MAG: hypothetical protein ACLS7P_11870 [Blautia sp.]